MKLITVPKTPEAMERLDFDQCSPEELFEVELNQEQFDQLWNTGVLDRLNEKLGLMIDDYEDESITTRTKLRNAQAIVALQLAQEGGTEVVQTLNKLIEKAIECRTGVFFYF